MEKRGSGLRRIQTLTASLPTYSEGKQPFFESDNQMFYTIVENVNYGAFPGHAKSSHKSEKVPIESSHKNENVPIESSHKEVKLGKTARYIVERIAAFSDINAEMLAEELGISYRQVLKHIDNLTKAGIIEREGGKRYGRWKIRE